MMTVEWLETMELQYQSSSINLPKKKNYSGYACSLTSLHITINGDYRTTISNLIFHRFFFFYLHLLRGRGVEPVLQCFENESSCATMCHGDNDYYNRRKRKNRKKRNVSPDLKSTWWHKRLAHSHAERTSIGWLSHCAVCMPWANGDPAHRYIYL